MFLKETGQISRFLKNIEFSRVYLKHQDGMGSKIEILRHNIVLFNPSDIQFFHGTQRLSKLLNYSPLVDLLK